MPHTHIQSSSPSNKEESHSHHNHLVGIPYSSSHQKKEIQFSYPNSPPDGKPQKKPVTFHRGHRRKTPTPPPQRPKYATQYRYEKKEYRKKKGRKKGGTRFPTLGGWDCVCFPTHGVEKQFMLMLRRGLRCEDALPSPSSCAPSLRACAASPPLAPSSPTP